MSGTKSCPFCGEEIKTQAIKCRHCQSMLDGSDQAPASAGAIEKVIPVSNPAALVAYYLGVFSLIPIIGLLLGPCALILGLVGRSKVKRAPGTPGTGHAWAGIILGGLVTVGHLLLIVLPIIMR